MFLVSLIPTLIFSDLTWNKYTCLDIMHKWWNIRRCQIPLASTSSWLKYIPRLSIYNIMLKVVVVVYWMIQFVHLSLNPRLGKNFLTKSHSNLSTFFLYLILWPCNCLFSLFYYERLEYYHVYIYSLQKYFKGENYVRRKHSEYIS